MEVPLPDHGRDFANFYTGERHWHEKNGDPAMTLGFGVRAHDQKAELCVVRVRGPDLRSIYDVVVSLTNREGPQRHQVGAGLGLRESLTPEHLPARDPGQMGALLLLASEGHDRRSDPVHVHVLRTPRLPTGPKFLTENGVAPGGGVSATILSWPVLGEPPARGEQG